MATDSDVGEINDLVKLLDEYQLQVPLEYRKVWEFNTVQEAKHFLSENNKKVFEDRPIESVRKDEKGNKLKDEEGNVIFDPVLNENGKIQIRYCPVGEMVVHCIEKAAKMMGSPVHITGGYLMGYNWAECH